MLVMALRAVDVKRQLVVLHILNFGLWVEIQN